MRLRWLVPVVAVVALVFSATSALAAPTEATVGKSIFFDTRLSSPPGQSCGTCHNPVAGWADPAATSTISSRGAISDRFGPRNTPSAAYADHIPPFSWDASLNAYVGGQFWDGRANSLEEQAKGPFLNPLEMNMPSEAAVVQAVAEGPYATDFKAVYGPNSLSLDDVDGAYSRIVFAIAAYERSMDMNRFSSKHDYAMTFPMGPQRMQVFSMQERQGMMLFQNKGKCMTCHSNGAMTGMGGMGGMDMGGTTMTMTADMVMFSDYRYANLGIPKNPSNPFYALPAELNSEGAAYVDHGLAAVMPGGVDANPTLDGMFKTPSLRNIAKTAPYGHNGYFPTLKSIVHFYNTRDTTSWPEPEVASNLETATMGALGMTDAEENLLVTFLGTLTDGWWGNFPDAEPPVSIARMRGTVSQGSWYSSECTMVVDAVDFGRGVASIQYRVGDGEWQEYLAPLEFLDDTSTVVSYRARDIAGNVEATQTQSIGIDRVGPVIASANDGQTYFVGQDVKVDWSARDAVGCVESSSCVRANGSALPTGEIGDFSYEVSAIDEAGNASTKTVAYSVVDRASSTLAVTSGSAVLASSGASYTFTGALVSGGAPFAGAMVVLETSSDGVNFAPSPFSTTTASDGTFAFSVKPLARTWYRAVFAGDVGHYASLSGKVSVLPRAGVANPIAPLVMSTSVRKAVYGQLRPRHTAGTSPVRIYRWRLVGGRWRPYGYVTARVSNWGAYSKYSVTMKFPATGRWKLRAYAPADAGHAATWSTGADYVTVR